MANVLNKTTLEYIQSVDTSKYLTGEWLINPQLPSCERKYWKVVGEEVVEMSAEEKEVVNQAELEAEWVLLKLETTSLLSKTDWMLRPDVISRGARTQEDIDYAIEYCKKVYWYARKKDGSKEASAIDIETAKAKINNLTIPKW